MTTPGGAVKERNGTPRQTEKERERKKELFVPRAEKPEVEGAGSEWFGSRSRHEKTNRTKFPRERERAVVGQRQKSTLFFCSHSYLLGDRKRARKSEGGREASDCVSCSRPAAKLGTLNARRRPCEGLRKVDEIGLRDFAALRQFEWLPESQTSSAINSIRSWKMKDRGSRRGGSFAPSPNAIIFLSKTSRLRFCRSGFPKFCQGVGK